MMKYVIVSLRNGSILVWLSTLLFHFTLLSGSQRKSGSSAKEGVLSSSPARSPTQRLNSESFFNVWNFRDTYKSFRDLDLPPGSFERATLDFSSPRLQRFLSKALTGRALNMLVIGGSNSAGGGIPDLKKLYYNVFSDWWNKAIKPQTGSGLSVSEIAIGGTGSDFFTFCLQNFINKAKQPDIILVELSVNDYGSKYGSAAQPLELLTRRLLNLPSRPAVFYIALVDRLLVDGKFLNKKYLNMEDLGQRELAKYYRITLFSWREIACPPLKSAGDRKRRSCDSKLFNKDNMHIGAKAHAQTAMLIMAYFKNALGKTDQDPGQGDRLMSLPRPTFVKSNVTDKQVASSLCLSYLTPNWKKPLTQSLSIKIKKSEHFHYRSPKKERQKRPQDPNRTDAFGSWVSSAKTGKLIMGFHVPPMEETSKSQRSAGSRSVAIIFRSNHKYAVARVWLDNDRRTTVHLKSSACGNHMTQTHVYPFWRDVKPGYHTISVSTRTHKGEFAVSGIIIAYPGLHRYEGFKPLDVKGKPWSYEDYVKLRC